MTKTTSIVLLCLFLVVVLFFGAFAFIPDGLEFGEYKEFYSPYTLIQRSGIFGDTVKTTYQIKLKEGVEFANVKKIINSRLQYAYGYYSTDISEADGVVTINMPQSADSTATSASTILSNVSMTGKFEIMNVAYTSTTPSYDSSSVLLSAEHLRSVRTRSYVNGEDTYYICQVSLTKEGAALVKKAKLSDSTNYYCALDETVAYLATYTNNGFQIYTSGKEACKVIASYIKYGELGAELTLDESVDVENNTGWIFSVVMAVVVLAVLVFLAVRYKTLGIAGILSHLIAIVIFMYVAGLIHLSIFNLYAAIGLVLAYAFMTFFTIWTFERIRAKSEEKTFATAAYYGFHSTNIVSLIAHASLLVLGIVLWVIPTAVTAPLGNILTYGALLSFIATFGLNRLFVKFVEPFNETSGKTTAKK